MVNGACPASANVGMSSTDEARASPDYVRMRPFPALWGWISSGSVEKIAATWPPMTSA